MQKAGDKLNTDSYNSALRRVFMSKDYSVSSRVLLYTTGQGEADDNLTLYLTSDPLATNQVFLQIQVVYVGQDYHDNGSGYEIPLQWDNIRDLSDNIITYTTQVTYHTVFKGFTEYRITATEFTIDSVDRIIFLDGTNIDIQYAKNLNLHYITKYNRNFNFNPAINGFPVPDIITPTNLIVNQSPTIANCLLFTTQYLNSASFHTEKVYAFGEPEELIFAIRKNRDVQINWTPPASGGYLKINGVNVSGTSGTLIPYQTAGNLDYYKGEIYGEGLHVFNFKKPAGTKRNIKRLVVLQHAKSHDYDMDRPLNFPITNKIINDFIVISNRNYYIRPISLNRFIASDNLQAEYRHIETTNFTAGLSNDCKFFLSDNQSWDCWE